MKRLLILALILGLLFPQIDIAPGPAYATVVEVTARNDYTGNASTTAFPYTFRIINKTDIEVLLDGTAQTVDSAYTVSGLGNSAGGTVTFATAPGSGVKVTLIRKQPVEQGTDYLPGEAYNPPRVEQDLDKAAMSQQMQAEQLSRSLHVNKQSGQVNTELSPTGCGGKAVVWTATPTAFDCSTISASGTLNNPVTPEQGGTGSANTTGYTKAGLGAAGTAGRRRRVTDDKGGWVSDNGSNWAWEYPAAVAENFTGANAGARIQAAINSLPATGGVVDARGFEGAQTATATITIPANVVLRLGFITLSSSSNPVIDITGSGAGLVGESWNAAGTGGSVIKNTGTGDTLRVGTGTAMRGLILRDFILDGNDTAAKGIVTNAAGSLTIERVFITLHKNTGIEITAGIQISISNTRINASASRLAGAYGIFVGTDGGNTTTTRLYNNYILGYAVSLKSDGINTASVSNIYETATDGIQNSNNGFDSYGDYFEAVSGFPYVLIGAATVSIINPQGVSSHSSISISGYTGFENRLFAYLAIGGLKLSTDSAAITGHLSATAALDFDLTATSSQDLTITVPRAALGDSVELGVPHGSVTADTLFWAWVSAANTVTVRAMRIAGTPNPASGTFRVDVWKH